MVSMFSVTLRRRSYRKLVGVPGRTSSHGMYGNIVPGMVTVSKNWYQVPGTGSMEGVLLRDLGVLLFHPISNFLISDVLATYSDVIGSRNYYPSNRAFNSSYHKKERVKFQRTSDDLIRNEILLINVNDVAKE